MSRLACSMSFSDVPSRKDRVVSLGMTRRMAGMFFSLKQRAAKGGPVLAKKGARASWRGRTQDGGEHSLQGKDRPFHHSVAERNRDRILGSVASFLGALAKSVNRAGTR